MINNVNIFEYILIFTLQRHKSFTDNLPKKVPGLQL